MESLFYDFSNNASPCDDMIAVQDNSSSPVDKSNLCNTTSTDEAWLTENLEQFWGAEKHRYIQHDSSFLTTSTTEQQLAYEDFLSQPPKPQERKARHSLQHSASDFYFIVKGEDINDIPTKYVVNGLEKHEFPVIGTYVDRRVIAGFKYRVRINRTGKYLFDGAALVLQSLGRGYGKRITFEGDSLNDNDNYFYSDTIAQGYGFSPIAVEAGDALEVRDPSSGEFCGRLTITELRGAQTELDTSVDPVTGEIQKRIHVDIYAQFSTVANSLLVGNPVSNWSRVRCTGTAYVTKGKRAKVASLDHIELTDCALAGYELQTPNAQSP